MTWYAWALVAWLTTSALYNVWLIDRPRKPKTAGEAICALIEIGLACWAVVSLASA